MLKRLCNVPFTILDEGEYMTNRASGCGVAGLAVLLATGCMAPEDGLVGPEGEEELAEVQQGVLTLPAFVTGNKTTIYVDFGGQLTLPSSPYWNDAQGLVKSTAAAISLKSSEGYVVGPITLKTTGSWNTTHPYGTLTDAFGYPDAATQDAVYGNTGSYGGFSAPSGSTMELAGLDTSVTYTIDFFCSAKKPGTETWNRATKFTITGATSSNGTVDCTWNDDTLVTLSAKPNTSGKIVINVTEGTGNSQPEGFYHLNNMRIMFAPDFGVDTMRPINVTQGGVYPPKGYYEYLPSQYGLDVNKKWPVIISMSGVGELGDGTTNTSTGLPQLNGSGTGLQSVIHAKTWVAHNKFVVITPQDDQTNGYFPPTTTEAVINWVTSHYRVDPDRIYILGLSYGGRVTWDYINYYGSASQAAAVIMAPGDGCDDQTHYCAKTGQTPIWSFQGRNDTDQWTNLANVELAHNQIKACATPPIETPKLTVYNNAGHYVWNPTYLIPTSGDDNYTIDTGSQYSPYTQAIYYWLLAHTLQ
jgi:hypothetical protein